MSSEPIASVVDVWESHPKLGTNSSCLFSFIVERETNLKDRKCPVKPLGSSASDWTWATHPHVLRKQPGHMATTMSRLVQFCHPSFRNMGKRKPVTSVITQAEGLPSIQQLKILRNNGDISSEDFKALKSDSNKCELEAMQQKGTISDLDLQKLQCDLRQSEGTCELKDMQEKCLISAADLPRLLRDLNKLNWENAATVRQAENTRDLREMRDNKSISEDDLNKLKIDFERCELEAMLEKGCISNSDLHKLKCDLRQSETVVELNDMQKRCLISAADLPQLLSDLNKLYSEKKASIKKSEEMQDLKDMRDSALISVDDFNKLKVDFERCVLEAMQERGSISQSDLLQLKSDLGLAKSMREIKAMQKGGLISAADLQQLLDDLNKFQVEKHPAMDAEEEPKDGGEDSKDVQGKPDANLEVEAAIQEADAEAAAKAGTNTDTDAKLAAEEESIKAPEDADVKGVEGRQAKPDADHVVEAEESKDGGKDSKDVQGKPDANLEVEAAIQEANAKAAAKAGTDTDTDAKLAAEEESIKAPEDADVKDVEGRQAKPNADHVVEAAILKASTKPAEEAGTNTNTDAMLAVEVDDSACCLNV